MIQIKYKNWIFEADPMTTKDIYERVKCGGAEECGCSDCKNYQKQRDVAFSEEIIELLERLGIDYRKEAEVCHLCRKEDGYHQYNGWFHFIGRIKKADNKVQESKYSTITEDFNMLFTKKRDLANKEFNDYPLVQLEYATSLPWIIKEKESE